MKKIKVLIVSGLLLFIFSLHARENKRDHGATESRPAAEFRSDCVTSLSKIDLEINNVRARLLGGGDMWWDLSDGRYIIPKVDPAVEDEVSSIFAAALWIGGKDAAGNLKMAAQTYRQEGDDFWPGPLDENGNTDQNTCSLWDVHFTVLGESITLLINDYTADDNNDGQPDNIINDPVPSDLYFWPGRGNPHFTDLPSPAGFNLPDQDLAPFFDADSDGIYDPEQGDFPVINVIGCESEFINDAAYADQMIFWIYNDKGNIHGNSRGDAIGMEIHALAFAYATNDEINNMTFYKYTLLNKATQNLFDTYIGQWVDPDLGCWNNDFVGCDTSRSLGIAYNGTATDPDCAFGTAIVQGYGNEVPMLGIDYFRGPTDSSGKELGMSTFVYFKNSTGPQGDPKTAQEYYRYLSGFWKYGSQIEYGGDGYNQGTFPFPYTFPSDPTDTGPDAWSECSENNAPGDRRFVQASGPFLLEPGKTNEVIIGAVWVPDVTYPCPSFSKLQEADDKAQGLFDNCFKLTNGPTAPDLCIIELDQELIIALDNQASSNNFLEGYSQPSPNIPLGFLDSTYKFQGYLVYQLANPTVVSSEYSDADKARLVAKVDRKDGTTKLFNYLPAEDPDITILIPNVMVEGEDSGIRHSFRIQEDLFATGDKRLINHKKYYYSVIAYASNDYKSYDPRTPSDGGQQLQYLEGRLNIKGYTGIPHLNDPENGGTIVKGTYGEMPEITRIDGIGHSERYLKLTETSSQQIFEEGFVERITYESESGPFTVKVFNPLAVVDGKYTLELLDNDTTDQQLKDSIYWILTDQNNTQYFSDQSLDVANEQLISALGISIEIEQSAAIIDVASPSGAAPIPGNGLIGANVTYEDRNEEWYSFVSDDFIPAGYTNFVRTKLGEEEALRDPERIYSNVLSGAWYPYSLLSWKEEPVIDNFITPVWTSVFSKQVDARNFLFHLNNVDIYLTADKSKWSRCVVLNTFSHYHEKEGLLSPDTNGPYGLRSDPSIDQNGDVDNSGTTGFSWFPGYAVDVETGERVNLFFGENTFYSATDPTGASSIGIPTDNGHDMIWNPSSSIFEGINGSEIFTGTLAELPLGGQHTIYVTNERYDSCKLIGADLAGNNFEQISAWSKVTWTSMPLLPPGYELNTMADGLIKNDLKFELRVNRPFTTFDAVPDNVNGGYNKYEFTIEGKAPEINNNEIATSALDLIQVVPNPYYAFSAYENSNNESRIKITNLPAQCAITIYSLDGQLIQRYKRNEDGTNLPNTGSKQVYPAIEWDMKNSKGIQVSSGVYIIHINAEGIGERVIKWFGTMRKFDSLGL